MRLLWFILYYGLYVRTSVGSNIIHNMKYKYKIYITNDRSRGGMQLTLEIHLP